MPALGAGVHRVRVASHVLGKSGTGTPHVAVMFEDEHGDSLTWYGYLTDKALERTIASLEILGWDPVAHDGRIDSLNGTGILEGNPADIVVEMESYQNELRPKVKWVNRPGGSLGDGMAVEDANAFAAQLRAKILSAPRPKATTTPGAARPAAAAGAGARKPLSQPDDDLPF